MYLIMGLRDRIDTPDGLAMGASGWVRSLERSHERSN